MNQKTDLLLVAVLVVISLCMACVSARAFVTRSWRRWKTLGLSVSLALMAASSYFTSFDRAAPSPRTNLLWKAAMVSLVVTGGMVWYAHTFSKSKPKDAKMDEQRPEPRLPRDHPVPIPGWKPQSPPAIAADLPRVCALHRVVVLHCWAVWDGHDIPMDRNLQQVREEFAPDLGVYALDMDDEANWDFVRNAKVGNIPALVCLIEGAWQETRIGVQPATVLRVILKEWLAEACDGPANVEQNELPINKKPISEDGVLDL